MSNLREAAQQALEFVELCWRDVHLTEFEAAKRDSVEEALRAALAQPDDKAQPVAGPSKPDWDSHAWPQIVQDSAGNWYGVRAGWTMCIASYFKGEELNLLREDGEFLKRGEPSPNWRNSLERRHAATVTQAAPQPAAQPVAPNFDDFVDCDECNGVGFRDVERQVAERKSDVQTFREDCESCGGSGKEYKGRPLYAAPQPPACQGDTGECAFNGACMYRCGRLDPPAEQRVEVPHDHRRETVILLASEVGFIGYGEDSGEFCIPASAFYSRLERFAALVLEHGRKPLTDERKAAEHEYATTAFDYARNPIGSRDWTLYWAGWLARSVTNKESSDAE